MDEEATRSRSRREGDDGGHSPPEAEASPESGGGSSEDDLDLISRLPDCILGEIVTRLPTADAVRVQLLSTRWRQTWSSSPLNLDIGDDKLRRFHSYRSHRRLVSALLAVHPGPTRRLKLAHSDDRVYNRWLWDPAFNGLRELEIDADRSWWYTSSPTKPLPDRALRFAPTLRVLKIGRVAFPSASSSAAASALRFPRLELLSFLRVDVSEGTLHGVLAGCPVLKTLVLNHCTGFAKVHITSPTITSFAISASQSHDYTAYPDEVVPVRLRQVVVEDAPLLEKLVPFREELNGRSFELRVVNAPRLRVLGSLSMMTSKLELGAATVFNVTSRRVNHVTRESAVQEKRSLMHAVMLATTLPTVKVLAVEDVDCVHDVANFLRCFPRLEKIYVSVSNGFRSVGSYEKLNPIQCLEHHLKMVAISGYEGKRSHVKLAKFFLRSARVLQLMKFRSCSIFVTKGWIVDQQRQLQVRNMACHNVKFHFVPDSSYQDVYCGNYIEDMSLAIHDSSGDDPYHQWFES
ncbi:unnamed protein product [Urochloa decumbens]|uniref:F-box domain-containing protein n=1 Tax=Urochloa decumbens TaxID=240449 RepID=A0ABC9FQG7_9POAL